VICHDRSPAAFKVEVDVLGTGDWQEYDTLGSRRPYLYHVFPSGFSAHWVRTTPTSDGLVSAEFFYT
jgi:hypothetical protein